MKSSLESLFNEYCTSNSSANHGVVARISIKSINARGWLCYAEGRFAKSSGYRVISVCGGHEEDKED